MALKNNLQKLMVYINLKWNLKVVYKTVYLYMYKIKLKELSASITF